MNPLFWKFAIVWILCCAVLLVILWRSTKRHEANHHPIFKQDKEWENLK